MLKIFNKKHEDQSPRAHAKAISEEKEKPHHIEKKSTAVLQTEYFSLINTKEAFRDEKWLDKWKELTKEILKHEEGNLILASFEAKYGNLGRIPR